MLDRLTPRKALLLSLLVMLLAIVWQAVDETPHLVAGDLPNPDSFFKLVLLREYTPATGFQFMARDNAPYGAYLHWSAVHSWVMLKLAQGLMHCGMSTDQALLWAGGGLTLLSMLALSGLVAWTTIRQGGLLAAPVAILVLATSEFLFGYGRLVQLTHHIFMLVPLAAAAACFLRDWGAGSRWSQGIQDVLGGACLGLALWISPETMPLVVAMVAVRTAGRIQYPSGAVVCPVAVGLMAMLLLAWHADPPPPTFSSWAMDHVSLAWLLLGGLIAGLLVVADILAGMQAPLWPVVLILSALLVGMSLIWLHVVPGAEQGAASLMPPEMRALWWIHIGEMQAPKGMWQWVAGLFMPVVAALLLAVRSWRSRSLWMAVLAATTLAYAAMTAWHVRSGAAAAFLAALAYGVTLARVLVFSAESPAALGERAQWTAVGFVLLPVVKMLVDVPLQWVGNDEKAVAPVCRVADVAPQLNKLPVGVILSSTNDGAELLWRTRHSIIASNYHHNVSGILDVVHIWNDKPPYQNAMRLLAQRNVSYLLACGDKGGVIIPQKTSKLTLWGRASQGLPISGFAFCGEIKGWRWYARGEGCF